MYQNQNYTPGSPSKKFGNENSSPMGSPLKQPRSNYASESLSYKPPHKENALGQSIEIIAGKSKALLANQQFLSKSKFKLKISHIHLISFR